MIWYYILLMFTSIITAIFSFLPVVTTLPTVLGVNLDTALSTSVGYFYAYTAAIWPIRDVFVGSMFLLAYFALKMLLRFFLGHRAPGGLH